MVERGMRAIAALVVSAGLLAGGCGGSSVLRTGQDVPCICAAINAVACENNRCTGYFVADQSVPMTKNELVQALLATLRAELATAERLARETAEAANHPEARPENDKDTRKLELSYLAQGQAARVRELETTVAALAAQPPRAFAATDPVALGALVELETDGRLERVLLCAGGGGASVEDDRGSVRVVTPEAPLAKALFGKTVGDEIELSVAGRKRELAIVKIA